MDPQDPDDVIDLVARIDEVGAEEDAGEMLEVLDGYLHFRMEREPFHAGWRAAHGVLEGVMEGVAATDPLRSVLESGSEVAVDERREALAQTRIVQASTLLLAWLGTGRTVTATGSLRRADIGPVAQLLGLEVAGAAHKPAWEPQALFEDLADPPPRAARQVTSMLEVPELVAWWSALQLAGIVEVNATKARPGAAAPAWLAEATPPHDLAAMLVGLYLEGLLTQNTENRVAPLFQGIERLVSMATVTAMLRALGASTRDSGRRDGDLFESLLRARVLTTMQRLADVGLLEIESGEATVPLPLRAALARGTATAIAVLTLEEEDLMG